MKPTLRLILSIICLLLAFGLSAQTTITSATSGNWNAGATWVGGTAPTSANHVVIQSGHTITMTADRDCINLTINTGGILNLTTFLITTTGNMVINGLLTENGSGFGKFKSKATSSAIIFDGTGSILVSKVQLDNTTFPSTANLNFTCPDLTVYYRIDNYGVISLSNFQGTRDGEWHNHGTLNFSGTSFGPFANGFTFDASPTCNTVNYNNSGNQTVYNTPYQKLTLSGSGDKTIDMSGGGRLTNHILNITGTAKAKISNNNIIVKYLTFNNTSQIVGTWGATTAIAATNKNDTYFSVPNTGYLNVESLYTTTNAVSLAGTNANCTQFSANWSAYSGAVAYFLDVSTVNTFATFVTGYNNLNVGNVLTKNVTGLTPGTTYYYRVRALTICGTSGNSGTITYATLPVTAVPDTISGTTTQCPSLKGQTYSISAVPNATTYTWTVPAGWTITSGAGTISITVTTGTSGGNISVTAGNSCGTSAPRTLAVSVNTSSIDFDGVDDYIDFGNVHGQTGVFSMEAWVLQEVTTTTGAIISKGDIKSGAGNQRGYHLVLNNGKPNLTWYNNAGTTILNIESTIAISNNKWCHIAVVYNGSEAIIYVNGIEVKRGSTSTAPVSGTQSFLIGAMYDSTTPTNPKNYFNGFIDEVRVWNVALTEQQIQEMKNQEIQLSGTAVRGKIIPKDISGGCLWANLKGYYPMNDGTATDLSSNGINGIPKNICLSQSQTAPMPYVTSADGAWTSESTWLHGNVWDIENMVTNNDGNIVKISNNVTANQDIKNYGLIIDSNKTLTITGDNQVENTGYLELNGTIDLNDDSQLIQTNTSDLVTSATGKILRRQEGTSSAYWYNYWASPVGATGVTTLTDNNAATHNANNTNFNLNMLKDGSNLPCAFTSAYTASGNISTYWLYTFINGLTYYDWAQITTSKALSPGVGYTQKGTGVGGTGQQYIFEGKPNNGTILLNVTDTGGEGSVVNVSKTEYLIGNPYPSALNIEKFINDNEGVIDGTIQLWQQWSGTSHNLNEYNGGYAQVTKLGSTRAYQFVGISGGYIASQQYGTVPTKYLPVGQGFIVEIIADGHIEFNNSQRVFIKEADYDGTVFENGSVFSKSANSKASKTSASIETGATSVMQKIRLEFNSVSGPETKRELLLGFSAYTTDDYDYGYEAKCTDLNNNDLNLNLDGKNMNMQAYSELSNDKVVPLNFKSSGNNAFEIRISKTEHISKDQAIYLKDNSTGMYFDLTQDAPYNFTSTQGIFNKRFEMVFQSKQQSLSTKETLATDNFMYYQHNTNTFYAKKLNADIKNLSLINMRGQIVMQLQNVSTTNLEKGIRFDNMAAGTYVVCLRTEGNEVLTKKIVIY